MTLRTNLSRLRKLLATRDAQQVDQAIELAISLDDPEVYEALWKGVCWKESLSEETAYSVLCPGPFFTASARHAQPAMDKALWKLLSRAPDTCARARDLREQLTSLMMFPGRPSFESFDMALLRPFKRLKHVDVATMTGVVDLAALAALPALESLNLRSGSYPDGVGALAASQTLTSLIVSARFFRLGPLGPLPSLTSLDLIWCPDLKSLDGLQDLAGLQELALHTVPLIEDLAPLARIRTLRYLAFSGMTNLKLASLRGVENCHGLSSVYLSNLPALASLDGLPARALERVEITACEALSDVSALRGASGLTHLDLRGARALRDVSVLAELPCLRALWLAGSGVSHDSLAPKLKAIASFDREP